MIYFTSDMHFYRKKTPHIGERTFENAAARDAFLVQQWNATVCAQDEVYVLGDASEGDGVQTNAMLQKLNGTKYLIAGNHDRYLTDADFDTSLYAWVKDYFELYDGEDKFVLFHYPIEAWSGWGHDRIHLHGHVHCREAVPVPLRRYGVGVDAHDGCPVSIDAVRIAMEGLHNRCELTYPTPWR